MLNVNNNRDYISRPQFWMAWGQRSGWHYILSLSVLFPTTTKSGQPSSHKYVKRKKKSISYCCIFKLFGYDVQYMLYDVQLSAAGTTLPRCSALSSGRTATQTCHSTSSVLSPSVSSFHSCSSPPAACSGPLAVAVALPGDSHQVLSLLFVSSGLRTNVRSTSVIPWFGMYLCIEACEPRHAKK